MCEDTTRQGSSGASGGHHPGPHALRPSHTDAAIAPNRLSLFVRSYRTALSSPWLKIILANVYEVWSQLPCYWADFDAREKGRGKGSLFSSGVIGKRVPKKRDSLTACTRGPGKVRGTPRWEEACAEERGNRCVGSLPMRSVSNAGHCSQRSFACPCIVALGRNTGIIERCCCQLQNAAKCIIHFSIL